MHRDFKPDNIMIGSDGRVRVMDFGLARAGDSEAGETLDIPGLEDSRPSSLDESLTRTGAVVGTPAYMAPEQFSGLVVTAHSDQFAFCVTLHEALFGVRLLHLCQALATHWHLPIWVTQGYNLLISEQRNLVKVLRIAHENDDPLKQQQQLDADLPLDWFAVTKALHDPDGAAVECVQFERLIGQATAFLRTHFMSVPRDLRFIPIKKRADLHSAAEAIGARLENPDQFSLVFS